MSDLHPLQPDETIQGMLQLLFEMLEYLAEISGLDACSFLPAAGAQGELAVLLVAAAYLRHRGEPVHGCWCVTRPTVPTQLVPLLPVLNP